jgi:aminomethyltransferase
MLMLKRTPFHQRLEQLNESGLWGHWAGYLSAPQYDLSAKHEYFGIRNAAAFFDASPLRKYWIRGRDAEAYLSHLLARDIRTCKPGRAQYTIWCDDAGFVMEDGVIFRHAADEFLLTAAEPNLGYLRSMVGRRQVEIVDCSEEYATLAIQGPRSRAILAELAPEVADLRYFAFTHAKIADRPVVVSRTGFTGDLGFEVMIPAEDALAVLDQILEAGAPHHLRPMGDIALGIARIEAGLPLIGVEFTSSRYAFVDADRFTPSELGLGWLLKGIEDETRPFVGRTAILRELREGKSRWSTVGISIAWRDYYDLFSSHGLMPVPDETPVAWESMIYDASGDRLGYATSLTYSPLLQHHIGIARIRPDAAAPGTTIYIEQTVCHQYINVAATVSALPFFNPERKTSMP